jgi:hypothetical protein
LINIISPVILMPLAKGVFFYPLVLAINYYTCVCLAQSFDWLTKIDNAACKLFKLAG